MNKCRSCGRNSQKNSVFCQDCYELEYDFNKLAHNLLKESNNEQGFIRLSEILVKEKYGYCSECQAKENGNYKNAVALPFKPLFNFYKLNRFERSCNDRIDIFGDKERY